MEAAWPFLGGLHHITKHNNFTKKQWQQLPNQHFHSYSHRKHFQYVDTSKESYKNARTITRACSHHIYFRILDVIQAIIIRRWRYKRALLYKHSSPHIWCGRAISRKQSFFALDF
jgi:hypothetical protein